MRFSFLILLVLFGCSDDGTTDDSDSTTDAAATEDSGGDDDMDGGSDETFDSGPSCTTDCEIVEVVAGNQHTCGRRENGDVVCWGGNDHGELGDDQGRHEDCSPGGGVPRDCSGSPTSVADLHDVVDLAAAGGTNTMARTMSGEVVFWGLEDVPELGSDAREEHFSPSEIEDYVGAEFVTNNGRHSCIIAGSDGGMGLFCRGNNGSGQAGVDPVTGEVRTPTSISLGAVTWVAAAANGSDTTCAIAGGNAYCWGANDFGQLGDGSNMHVPTEDRCGAPPSTYDCTHIPRHASGISDLAEVEVGRQHACARTEDGAVYCWGDNSARQLGSDSVASSNTPIEVPSLADAEQIAVGTYFTCALDSDGIVRCVGFNEYGQLGDGLDDHETSCTIGDVTKDCSAEAVTVSLPGTATSVAAGAHHACAILDTADVYCWGYNDLRQLGDGTRESSSMPVEVQGLY